MRNQFDLTGRVSLVTGASRSLVRPLIESLRHPMVVQDPWLQREMGFPGRPFREALADSVDRTGGWKRPIARSVQRLPLPQGRDAQWMGRTYLGWLAGLFPMLLVVDAGPDEATMRLRGLRAPLLRLAPRDGTTEEGRYVLAVTGGLLAAKTPAGEPRLEFRSTPDGKSAIAALQDFEPRLPWRLYLCTQAPLHAAVMAAFRRWLGRDAPSPVLDRRGEEAPEAG